LARFASRPRKAHLATLRSDPGHQSSVVAIKALNDVAVDRLLSAFWPSI
jgi:hypothetical protein